MTKAFTLVEVLISVMILAVVGTGLLQISTNSKHNFEFLKQKSKFSRLASIAFIHNDQKYHHKDMTLYDFLRDDYPNLDDDLRKYLKDIKVSYSHEEFSTFSPLGEDNQTTDSYDNPEEENQMDLTIIYDKIVVSNKKDSTFAYKIYIPIGEGK
jgi:prepilin-type N-terminal cleavage/methylation domain-containing protein